MEQVEGQAGAVDGGRRLQPARLTSSQSTLPLSPDPPVPLESSAGDSWIGSYCLQPQVTVGWRLGRGIRS